jgi:hypothetical protein
MGGADAREEGTRRRRRRKKNEGRGKRTRSRTGDNTEPATRRTTAVSNCSRGGYVGNEGGGRETTTTTPERHTTRPQAHEQLLVGWIAGGMPMTTRTNDPAPAPALRALLAAWIAG